MLDEPQPIGTSAARDLKLIDAAQREAEEALRRAAQTAAVRNSPGSGAVAALTLPDALPGYEILREIHRGGQGVVYQAIQKSTQRKVAIKVLHEGPFAGPRSRVRFEREVQILGALNHPNIVTIHDSGRAAGDALYYVMDYVRGRSLREFVRERKLALEPALELFATVCEAVQHAHTRGIIHRDLKPGNILVDAEGRAIVVDFGFGKLLTGTGNPSGSPAVSMTQDVMGTLAYMSPEQTHGNADEIDTRTDVYSLGVILYELLTGRHPYTTTGSMPDVVHEIREAEPTPPSRSWSVDSGIATRSTRRLVAGRCPIDDEVQTIVLRCLAKEPARRYQSAGEIARDLRHYRAGQPIEAKRDSFGYLLRAQVRRHKIPLGIAAFIAIVIAGGLVSSISFWRQALADRDRARAINQYLQDMLASADPHRVLGQPNATVRQMLDQATQRVEAGGLRDHPEIEAAVRATLGRAYRGLGVLDSAETHLRAGLKIRRGLLGREHAEVAESSRDLAWVLDEQGKLDEAEPLFRDALEIRRHLFGDQHIDVATSMNDLGILLRDQGRPADAERLLRDALAIRRRLRGDEDPEVAMVLNGLAMALHDQGRMPDAIAASREAIALQRKLLGPEHLDLAASMSNLALMLTSNGEAFDAESLARGALEMRRHLLGEVHPDVAYSLNSLATVLRAQGRLDDSEALFGEALAMRRKILDESHPDLADSLAALAMVVRRQGRPQEAEPLYREELAIRRRRPGEPNALAATLGNLAQLLQARGDLLGAQPLFREALAIRRQVLPPDHPEIAGELAVLGQLLIDIGNSEEAEPLLRECLDIRERILPEDDPQAWLRYNTMSLLGAALLGQGEFEQAEPLLIESYEKMQPPPGPVTGNRKREALERIAKLYEDWDAAEPGTGKAEQAAEYRALLDAFDSATDH